MTEIREIIEKIQVELSPFVWDYLGNFIPRDKLPKKKDGSERCHCFNHRGEGLDKGKDLQFNPSNGTFHCYSCHANYNIFTLANLYEGKPLIGKDFYTKNVLYLAERYGVKTHGLEEVEIGSQLIKDTSLFAIMKEISEYITKHNNKEYTDFRGISEETAVLFGVGTIDSKENFNEFISKFDKKYLTELNILDEKTGGLNERVFSKTRLIITIKDRSGNPVSFSSREMFFTLDNAKQVFEKYYDFQEPVLKAMKKNEDVLKFVDLGKMNDKHIRFLKMVAKTNRYNFTKKSSIFNKKEILFGYHENKDNFFTTEPLKIIESPIDILTAHSHKEFNIVAIMGTAFTEENFEFLESNNKINKISFMLDNDSSGVEETNAIVEKIVNKINSKEGVINKYYVTSYIEGSLKDVSENYGVYESLYDYTRDTALFDHYLANEVKKLDLTKTEEIDRLIKIIVQEDAPFVRAKMIRNLYSCLEERAIAEGESSIFSESQIQQQVDYYVNKTDEKARRLFDKELAKLQKRAKYAKSDDINFLVADFKKKVTDGISRTKGKKRSIFEISLDTIEKNEELKYTEKPMDLKCGFDMFEDVSWTGDEMMVIIAKPHIGKTVFMCNMAINYTTLNPDTAVLYITTDDSTRKITNNLLGITTGLDKGFLNEPKNNSKFGLMSENKDKIKFQKAYKKGVDGLTRSIKSKRLVILQATEGYNAIENIEAGVEEFATCKELKDMKKMVIIDSVNNIKINGIEEDRAKIEFLSNYLKIEIAQRHKLVAMCNFNATKLDQRTRVNRSKIKGSGAIEYDADVIISLSQPLNELGSNFTNTKWLKAGQADPMPIIVPVIEKCKPIGGKYQAFFYKMDGMTSRISQIIDMNERKSILSSWINDNDKENKEGYRHDY